MAIKDEIAKVFANEFIHGFWRVAIKFFKFEFIIGAMVAYTIHWYFKFFLIPTMFIINTAGAIIFLILTVILTLALTSYIVPKTVISAIREIF